MINCIAIDDEPLALALLKDNISKVPFLKLVAACSDAFEAMESLRKNPVDLIFTDIQMPGLSGFQFISSLQQKPMVIFITAYNQYAVDSFDLDVVDYLVKPVSLERFIKACNRARERHEWKAGKPEAPVKNAPDYFFANVDYSQLKIRFDDILWMKGYGDYIKFHLKNQEQPLLVRMSFKELESILPPNKFLRIHKSYAVALSEITAIRKNSLFLGDQEFSIGESYREAVEKWMRSGS
ncbi:LytR/AlgR family response regulator transcription factor [Cyclobacterium jeungdonense]|uniref:LytTR family DNA-binding domain-containing protein n=1 Tax=Cyclobacterium jeungdonense TaxID=708087 RepID=A0ABT8C620_9BACT|nr:LytTR family DNA-binding domain-containing protein [Cyclobacterium jeungdonense]MDN3687228.1 LytTR family DNA-binding domain-containing protein [Cyclobacterium jeungdonense]